MTYKEYNYQRLAIAKVAQEKRVALDALYATENNPHKIGDIIEDHIGRILIDEMRVSRMFESDFPCMIYVGTEIKKDNTRKKTIHQRVVWQGNLISK